VLESKFQNFAMMRVVASTSVIFSHSYLIANGNEAAEPGVLLLGPHNILGIYGVFVFFFISGFLVTRSALSRRGVLPFVVKRALRIYPALIVCSFLSAAVFGSIFTSLTLGDYWGQFIPVRYAIKAAILPVTGWHVPSVSFPPVDANILHEGMNGSLWSISQELYAYIIIAVLLALGWLRMGLIAWLALIMALARVVTKSIDFTMLPMQLDDFVFIVPYFFAGSLVYFIHERWGWSGRLALIISVVVMLLGLFGHFMLGFLLAAYPVLWFGTTDRIRLPTLESVGDISYGLYLWGWPILQVARVLLGGNPGPITLFVVAWPITAALGYLSWHLLERHALALVPAVISRLSVAGKVLRRGRASEL
jgi:peptidoglycan/LPS O-acetylase OafA/YrhL